jgi:competence protein ComEC
VALGPTSSGSRGPRPFWLDDDEPPPASPTVTKSGSVPAPDDISLSPASLLAITIAIGWLGGLWLAAAIGSADALPLSLGAALIVSLLGIALMQRHQGGIVLAAIALSALVAGVLRYQPTLIPPGPDDISQLLGATVTVRGIVEDSPAPAGRWADYRIGLDERVDGATTAPVSGHTIARVPAYLEYRPGDRLELLGEVALPDTGDPFSYRDYLARQGIRVILVFPTVRLVTPGSSLGPNEAFAVARRTASLALERAVAEPSGPLAAAMIIGDRSGLPRELRDAFNAVGATHIIAISGINFALLVAFLLVALRPVSSRSLRLGITVAAVVLYAALVGPQPSVVRAAIMGALFAWGRFLGRPNDALTGLAVSAVGMTAMRPDWLWDVGFQLSFVATVGLVVLAPPIERALGSWPDWLRISIATTVAATIATAPITAASFGQIAPASAPVTLLSAPVVGPSMLAGAATVVAGMIWEPLAAAPGWITWALLRYMILVVEVFARLPGASLQVGPTATWLIVVYYGLLVFASVRSHALGLWSGVTAVPSGAIPPVVETSRRYFALLVGLAIAAAVVWVAALWPGERTTVVTFLDVGQGDATLIRTAGGRTVLIDGGPDGVIASDALGRRLPFWDRRVDVVLVTHTHEDHLAGLIEIVRRFRVDRVIQPAADGRSPVIDRWDSLLAERGVPITRAQVGQHLALDDDAVIEVLAVPEATSGARPSSNDSSAVYRITSSDQSVLVTGDLPSSAQRRLLASYPDVESSVLKVPHHGADDALDDEFLARVHPRVAVISVGERNRFGHPTAGTLQKLAPVRVFRTDTQGSVEVEMASDGLRARTQR